MSDRKNFVEMRVADGTTMSAYVARPQGAETHPGIMVFQEAFGVNPYIRDVADRFAKEGFTAIAPELFHRTGSGFEGSYTDFQATQPHVSRLTNEGLEADIRATHEWLSKDSQTDAQKIFSAGFCMGVRVSFYGGGIAQGLLDRSKNLHGPVLLFWGGLDKHILPEHTRAVEDAIRAAGKEFGSVTFSYADHGFFCDQRASYNEKASKQAWPMTLEFLKYHLK
ncbi:MAG: dienelactone hydrolase family protein [Bacteroidetes bacterium]|nr:dienelactone hydrolase family protein [Bacteroidota bacterium]